MVSTDPDLHLPRDALQRAGLEGHLRRVATGLDSTYRAKLTDGRQVAVRVAGPFDFRCPEATLMEAAWVRAIGRDTDLRVPYVVAPTKAEPFLVDDREGRQRGVLILSWVEGRKMRRRLAPHHSYALGAAAAVLHRHAHTFAAPPGAWAHQ